VKKPKQRPLIIQYGFAAAVGLFILVAAVFYLQYASGINSDELFTAYYNPLPASLTTRGDESNTNEAVSLYEGNQYAIASQAFEKLLLSEPENPKWNILLANCYLKLDRGEEAATLLKNMLNAENTFYRQYAHWYLSLTHLKLGELEQCKEVLNRVSLENMIHSKQAVELLEKLD